MLIIKLDATDSTNSYLRALSLHNNLEDFTTVVAKTQTNGRGQMGASWESSGGMNLTFSVLKNFKEVEIPYPFYISMVVSLAIYKALKDLNIPRLSIKWPNDILSENKKICGVLIENVIKKNNLDHSILGIGLNVNQIYFDNLPKASSLKLITGQNFNLDELLKGVLEQLKYYFLELEKGCLASLKTNYEAHLFRKNKPSTFKDAEGFMFTGYIKAVSLNGNLEILLEDNIIKAYSLKEVTLLY